MLLTLRSQLNSWCIAHSQFLLVARKSGPVTNGRLRYLRGSTLLRIHSDKNLACHCNHDKSISSGIPVGQTVRCRHIDSCMLRPHGRPASSLVTDTCNKAYTRARGGEGGGGGPGGVGEIAFGPPNTYTAATAAAPALTMCTCIEEVYIRSAEAGSYCKSCIDRRRDV